jgi:predicted acylesterase/phospholipase RssA
VLIIDDNLTEAMPLAPMDAHGNNDWTWAVALSGSKQRRSTARSLRLHGHKGLHSGG